MIQGRNYIPSNKSIEVTKDLNDQSYWPTKGIELPQKFGFDNKQATFSFTKPNVGVAPLPDLNGPDFDFIEATTLENSVLPAKNETMADKPPTLEEFADRGKMITSKYGTKVRLTGFDMDAKMSEKMMKMRIKVPKRDANGNIVFSKSGAMETDDIGFGELFSKDTVANDRLILNSLNNINQSIGPSAFLMLRTAFARGYDKTLPEEKAETYRNLVAMDTTGYLNNVDNLPYLMPSFYITRTRDLLYLLKYRIFCKRMAARVNIAQIDTDFRAGRDFVGPDYTPLAAINAKDHITNVMRMDPLFALFPIQTIEWLDVWYMENLFTQLPNNLLNIPAINANVIVGNVARTPYYLLAGTILDGIEHAVGNYQAWYEAQADTFLTAYSLATAAVRLDMIQRATRMTIVNGADLTQAVQRQAGAGGWRPGFFGGAVYTIPALPANRIQIRG
jgi:hypothetical protein